MYIVKVCTQYTLIQCEYKPNTFYLTIQKRKCWRHKCTLWNVKSTQVETWTFIDAPWLTHDSYHCKISHNRCGLAFHPLTHSHFYVPFCKEVWLLRFRKNKLHLKNKNISCWPYLAAHLIVLNESGLPETEKPVGVFQLTWSLIMITCDVL